MTKTLKKTLAIVVALALCLSAFMGCFSVGAVDANGVSIDTEINGDTAIVDFTLEAVADDAFTVALFDIEFDKALNIVGIPVEGIDPATELAYPDEPAIEISTTSDVELAEISHNSITNGDADVSVANAAKAIRVIVETKEIAKIADATVTITFDIAGLEAKDYAVSVTNVQAATAGTYADGVWSNDEALIKFGDATTTTATGAITVAEAACQHTTKVAIGEAKEPTCTENGITAGEKCADCGATITAQEEIPFIGHKPGNGIDNGDGTHDIPCANGDLVADNQEHSFVDGVCDVCGAEEPPVEPVYTTELNFTQAKIEFQSDLIIRYYATVPDGYTDVYLNCILEDGTEKQLQLDTSEGTQVFKYTGIPATQVGDTMDVTIYGTKDGTIYYSRTVNYGVAKFCYNQLKKSETTNYQKTVYVDLLNYASEAQKTFGYKTDSLANKDLTTEQAAFGTQGDVAADTEVRSASGTKCAYFDFKEAKLNYQSKVETNIYFNIDTTACDINNLSVKVNWTGSEGAKETTINGSDFLYSGTHYYIAFTGMAARDMRVPATYTLWENGIQIGRTFTYSTECFVAAMGTDVSKAALKYSDALTAYFNSLNQ